jgi:hypothetical protein
VSIHGSPASGSTMYAFFRKSVVLGHKSPRSQPALSDGALALDRTIVMWVHYRSRVGQPSLGTIRSSEFISTQAFRQENEFNDGIRPRHVAEVLADPTAMKEFDLNGVKLLLITRLVTVARDPYTILIIASIRETIVPEVQSAYRLYGQKAEVAALAASPERAFQTLLERYGSKVKVGTLGIPAVLCGQLEGDQAAAGRTV